MKLALLLLVALFASPQQDQPMRPDIQIVPLRDYIDMRIYALDRELDARLDAADEARKVHADTLTDRLMHSNGLIEQMRQQSSDLARKTEVEALASRIEALEQERSKNEGVSRGKEPLSAIWMMVLGAVIAAVVAYSAARWRPPSKQ